SYTVRVTLHDGNSISVSTSSIATVDHQPLAGTAANVHAVAGTSFTGLVATFTDDDPSAQVTDFTATIDWGSGPTSTGTITAASGGGNSPGTFNVTGTHTYSQGGTFPIHVTITDAHGHHITPQGGWNAVASLPAGKWWYTSGAVTSPDGHIYDVG